MNKKTIITMMLALVTVTGQAQEIKMNEVTINDYIPMLNAKGYQAYSFDQRLHPDAQCQGLSGIQL